VEPIDTVVVGAGISGLAAAYDLASRGLSVRVVERDDRAGGLVLTERIEGFVIDAGPDSLLAQKPAAIDLCTELGLGDRLVPTLEPRAAYVLRGGVLHELAEGSVFGIPVRLRALAASSLFTTAGKLRMAAEVFVPRRPLERGDESIGEFVRRRFGDEAVQYLAEPLLAGIHAGDVDRLSIRALFPRFAEAEARHGSVIRALRREKRRRSPDGAFRSLEGGLGELVAALVARLPTGTLHLNARAESIEHDDVFRVRVAGQEAIPARSVVLATPAYVTASLVRHLDAELSRLCGLIAYASSAAVVLAYRRQAVDRPLRGSGFVVPRSESRAVLAVSWVSSKWPRRSPSDMVLVRSFLGGSRDPAIIEREDHEIAAIADAELRPLLRIAERPLLRRVYRWHRANAQHEVGHLDRVRAIEAALARRPGLFVTGSGFRGVGIPDCVSDARAIARSVWNGLAGIR
jgi:oxygen-dependent protoporphyrinogen oxidase